MKKRILAGSVALALAMCTFTACGNSSSSDSSSEASSSTASTSADSYDISSIKFGTNPEFEPFEYISANGVIDNFDGIDMAIAVEIGNRLGADISMEQMEFDSLVPSIDSGKIDAAIAGMTITDEREESVTFTTPYYTATQVMIVKEDSDITSAADMEGKNIVVVQGYTGEVCVKEMNYEYEAFKKGTECILELENGKCDVVVIDSATAEAYVEENEGLKIVEDNDAFSSEKYGIAVSNDNPELLEALDSTISDMLEDGTIADIIAKYINDSEE